MLALCVCACTDLYINIFCPAVIFMSHLPILQFSPCCCHQHFVFSAWLLPASDSRDSKEDPALSTQQQNRSVWAALWQILQHKTQTCYFSFIWAIPRSQTEITLAGCQLPPFPPLWFLIPALHPRCLFPPAPDITLPGCFNALPCASVPAAAAGHKHSQQLHRYSLLCLTEGGFHALAPGAAGTDGWERGELQLWGHHPNPLSLATSVTSRTNLTSLCPQNENPPLSQPGSWCSVSCLD